MNQEQQIREILRRLEKLERSVFEAGAPRKRTVKEDFGGPTGGIRFLVSKNFFDRKRLFAEIEAELKKYGYHYSKPAIQMPLNRMSTPKGSLVALKEKGKKAYVKRK